MTTTTLRDENTSLGLAFSFRGLAHCLHVEKHGGMQKDMVLERDLRVLHLDLQAAEGDSEPHWA